MAAHRTQLEDQIATLETVLNKQTAELDAAQAQWEKETQPLLAPWTALEPLQVSSAAGASLTLMEDKSVLAGGKIAERDTYLFATRAEATDISGLRLEVLTDPSLSNGGLSRSANGNFILTGFQVEIAPETTPERSQTVKFLDAVSQHGSNVKSALDDDPATGWTFRADRVGSLRETQAIFLPEKPFGFAGGTRITIRLKHESTNAQQMIGRFRLSFTSAKEPGKSVRVPPDIQRALMLPDEKRPRARTEQLRTYYRSIAPSLNPVRQQLAGLRAQWGELAAPSTLVMKELSEPRKSYVHVRGNFLTRGKEVAPGTPAVLHPLRGEQRENRLALARWLIDEDNPLVARVALNRFWMHHFGRGIVETVEDFGRQGHPASHPELLDWLATEFPRQKWSMKALHRLIVTSATYRQSSRVSPLLLERDPANRLLARGPRQRLDAEMLRDNALSIAGLVSPRIGGPSVFPPQPEGVWNLVYNDDTWVNSTGEDRYRRGLYTFWRRTAPYPSFMTFDAPSREAICTRRIPTNTPLQSLTLLNDPVFLDAARGLARRILLEAPADLRASLTHGFRLCLGRRPDARELDRLVELFDQEFRYFSGDLQAAKELASKGDVAPPQDADIARFAALTVVANVLLNLDETLTRG